LSYSTHATAGYADKERIFEIPDRLNHLQIKEINQGERVLDADS
jgi:hypothetical protein